MLTGLSFFVCMCIVYMCHTMSPYEFGFGGGLDASGRENGDGKLLQGEASEVEGTLFWSNHS